MTKKLVAGDTQHRTVDGMTPVDYFLYLPEGGVRDDRVLVTVHGISRNAEEHVKGFMPQAELYGAAIVAPLFPQADFERYQRLGTSANEGRADLAFDHVIQEVSELLGLNPLPLAMFGFSGGGQFSHRYAMFYPRRVRRMVLGAPGWYTFPDPDRRYPLGFRSSDEWPRLKFNPARFLKIPTLVLVGDEDDLRDDDLNKSRQIDAFQGLDRVERGERWVAAMRAMSRAFNVKADFRFESVPHATHAFESYMAHPAFGERIFTFLFGEP